MGERLAEIEVRKFSDTLAVLDVNALVESLTERLAEVEINTLSNIFSKAEGKLGAKNLLHTLGDRLAEMQVETTH